MKDNILEISNLKKIYHTKENETLAIDNVSFKIKEKEFVSIVGPSGCGKSTILGIIAGLLPKTEGQIHFKKDKKTIGYMMQDEALFNWKTVLDNSTLGLDIRKELNKKSKDYAINLLRKYGLGGFMNSYPDNLSGGMKQRLALIRTLAIKPDILLLDEAFATLDYQTKLSVCDDVHSIIKNEGKTSIMVTHDIGEAVSMSDKVIVLSKRPCTIKKIYKIDLKENVPSLRRKDKDFIKYVDLIWKDLDV